MYRLMSFGIIVVSDRVWARSRCSSSPAAWINWQLVERPAPQMLPIGLTAVMRAACITEFVFRTPTWCEFEDINRARRAEVALPI